MRTNGWWIVAAFALAVVVAVGAVSTSAFTSMTLSRDTTVSVTADDDALVVLVDGHAGGLVEQTGGSTLAIDLTSGGADGTNANATVALGSTSQPVTDHAFRLHHRGKAPGNLTLRYAPDDSGVTGGAQNLVFTFYHDVGDDGTVEAQVTVSENTGSQAATLTDVAPGDPVYATVEFHTDGLSSASDLGGTLEVTVRGGG